MNINIWIVYVGTVLVLMSTPGPSQLLMLSNSVTNGFRKSIATALGDLSANFLQMIVASIGLVSLIQNFQQFFIIIKWAGVAYLMFIGLKLFISMGTKEVGSSANQRSLQSLYWQGFVTSAANPKAVIFFAALFPQFISPENSLFPQFSILSLTYLTLDGFFLSLYGRFAEYIAKKLKSSINNYINQISGAFLILAAILLGLKPIEE